MYYGFSVTSKYLEYHLLYIFRLLDICHGQRREREMSLYLVFEHVHQDLASYLEKCPSPGLQPERVKVSLRYYTNHKYFLRIDLLTF